MDLYVLSAHKHLFEDPRFRIVRIYDYKASYGVVLAGHSMKLEDCFTEHIKEDAADVFQSIEENVKILRVRLSDAHFGNMGAVDSLVTNHPWCTKKWSLLRGGRLREKLKKKIPKLNR